MVLLYAKDYDCEKFDLLHSKDTQGKNLGNCSLPLFSNRSGRLPDEVFFHQDMGGKPHSVESEIRRKGVQAIKRTCTPFPLSRSEKQHAIHIRHTKQPVGQASITHSDNQQIRSSRNHDTTSGDKAA